MRSFFITNFIIIVTNQLTDKIKGLLVQMFLDFSYLLGFISALRSDTAIVTFAN